VLAERLDSLSEILTAEALLLLEKISTSASLGFLIYICVALAKALDEVFELWLALLAVE